jgi:hypothetical protein
METIKYGSRGNAVKKLQHILDIKVDGDFGSQTHKEVEKFQGRNNLIIDGIVGSRTWSFLESIVEEYCTYSREQIQEAVKSKGYTYFQDEGLLNIIGIRNSAPRVITNAYDDIMTVSTMEDGKWIYKCWAITTDPGDYWINHPMNKNGCAILVPGQYYNAYKITKHRGKYDALCQRGGKVSVYRDGNLDDVYDHDPDTVTAGYYGINIHRSSVYRKGSYINKYSAGCQVFADPDDFDELMALAFSSKESGHEWFTYTLIESKDIL